MNDGPAHGSDGAAFDAVAADYDADFSHSPLGRLLRARLWAILDEALPANGHLLELGCGTGEDALHMARRGARVLATDQSPAMLASAAEKIAGSDLPIQTAGLDLAAPRERDLPVSTRFEGAWSSFGPLNCLADRQPLWRFLGEVIHPDGMVVVVVMAPFTPWDWLWFGGHGQLTAATRRLRSGAPANAGGGEQVRVWYPSWQTLRREAAPTFEFVNVEAIGALLPISEAGHLVARFPRIFSLTAQLEARIAQRWPWPSLCDHYALTLRRRAV